MAGSPDLSLPGGWRSEESIWQLVECCGYVADLPAWTGLCEGRSVLDLGCGIGRVGRHLAEAGREVLGLDRDPLMVEDFARLAPTGAEARQADVLDPGLSPGRFHAIIAPQQLIQIVGGPEERGRLLNLISGSLAPGGVAGIAITENLPRESASPDLIPDVREIEDWVFSSRPVSLEAEKGQVTVERQRHKISPAGDLTETNDQITFRRLDRASLNPEFATAGLTLTEVIDIPPTEAHMASSILVLHKL